MSPLRFGITSVFATLMSSINEDFFAIMPLDFDDEPGDEGAIRTFKEPKTGPADFVQDLELFAEMARLIREP
jgi:hypothetical protein